jgi:hypothetical protein
MGIFHKRPPPPPAWAQELLAQNQQLLMQMQQVQKGNTTIMSEDAAIEAQVAILVADQTALATAFATLNEELAAGTPPSAQTMTDLTNAVSAITGTIPPAPTPSP